MINLNAPPDTQQNQNQDLYDKLNRTNQSIHSTNQKIEVLKQGVAILEQDGVSTTDPIIKAKMLEGQLTAASQTAQQLSVVGVSLTKKLGHIRTKSQIFDDALAGIQTQHNETNQNLDESAQAHDSIAKASVAIGTVQETAEQGLAEGQHVPGQVKNGIDLLTQLQQQQLTILDNAAELHQNIGQIAAGVEKDNNEVGSKLQGVKETNEATVQVAENISKQHESINKATIKIETNEASMLSQVDIISGKQSEMHKTVAHVQKTTVQIKTTAKEIEGDQAKIREDHDHILRLPEEQNKTSPIADSLGPKSLNAEPTTSNADVNNENNFSWSNLLINGFKFLVVIMSNIYIFAYTTSLKIWAWANRPS
ncbi:MAG: hypothetical protein H0W88_02680 [Parachlamydiaceae bacterium]|nr:hypothetical protein [Parachlamydiaceae bacterium]